MSRKKTCPTYNFVKNLLVVKKIVFIFGEMKSPAAASKKTKEVNICYAIAHTLMLGTIAKKNEKEPLCGYLEISNCPILHYKQYITKKRMKIRIFVETFGILFLLIACSPIRKTVKDINTYDNSNLKDKRGKVALIDTLKVGPKTLIFGDCYYQDNPYNLYSFLLNDSASIVQFTKSLVAGKNVQNIGDKNEFNIWIVDDHLIKKHIAIMPNLGLIRFDGNSYEFDFGQIKELHKEHPLISYEKKMSFSNIKEAENYVTEIRKDTNLLFYLTSKINYEGSFTMTAEKSPKFNSPKALMDYLSIEIEKKVSKEEYEMYYSANVEQIDKEIQSDSYNIIISGSKELFDNLTISEVRKDNWKPFINMGIFHMKK